MTLYMSGYIMKNKKKTDYLVRARVDMDYMFQGSPFIRCDKCKISLGLLHILKHALFKKHGSIYIVPCKKCGYLNERTKGGLATEFDERWK